MSGVVVVDKPRGLTSHDVVHKVRGKNKGGHTGTLDPMATGVLPVCLGEATKLAQLLSSDEKAYEATLTLGTSTDTLDAEGKVVATGPLVPFDAAVLAKFRGTYLQTPPMYSAVKVGGRKLYEAARAGEELEREPREVTVTRLEVLGVEGPEVRLVVESSKGFYVRVLVAEIAKALGTEGHLSGLRRTRAGAFTLAQAVTMEEAAAGKGLMTVEAAVAHWPSVRVSETDVRKVLSGGRVEAAPVAGPVCVLGPGGRLLAIADVEGGLLKYRRVMAS
ncbi:MAG: tRNA pseudouridine(55) synthase TruB [Myxococcaceae bacterium]|nr:tRNA pseudouridine(55) synthase TruB [Myxococcaceae bacterium]